MGAIKISDVSQYIENKSINFNNIRLRHLKKFDLNDALLRIDPYLLGVQNILLTGDFVKALLDAYLSSQEETIFGNFLEGLAIFIN